MKTAHVAASLLFVTLIGCAAAPKQPRPDQAQWDFGALLKDTITQQTVENLRREAKFHTGYVMVQFHYLDGKILDSNVIYRLGDKSLGQDVVDQMMLVKVPAPIPALVGKRTRYILGFCFLTVYSECLEYEKRAYKVIPPESEDTPQP